MRPCVHAIDACIWCMYVFAWVTCTLACKACLHLRNVCNAFIQWVHACIFACMHVCMSVCNACAHGLYDACAASHARMHACTYLWSHFTWCNVVRCMQAFIYVCMHVCNWAMHVLHACVHVRLLCQSVLFWVCVPCTYACKACMQTCNVCNANM